MGNGTFGLPVHEVSEPSDRSDEVRMPEEWSDAVRNGTVTWPTPAPGAMRTFAMRQNRPSMLIRIVHGTALRTSLDATRDDRPGLDRDRLTRAATRIPGLETLIVGSRDDALEPGPDVAVLSWLDGASMVNATGSDDIALLRDRLGLEMTI